MIVSQDIDLSQPSLSIKEAEDGKVLMHCHAGCDLNDIRWLFDSFDCRASIDRLTNFHRTRDVVCELLRDRSGSVRYPPRKTVVLNHKEMTKMFQQATEFVARIFGPIFCEFRLQVLTAIRLKLLGLNRFDPLG